MIIVPLEVKCRKCARIFCCSNCRLKHEESRHKLEMEEIREQEYFMSICHLCNGQPLPFPFAAFGLIEHICKKHLPLKCDKCMKIFENSTDLKEIGACNHLAVSEKLETVSEVSEEPPAVAEIEQAEVVVDKENDGASVVVSSPAKLNTTNRRNSINSITFCKNDNKNLTMHQGRLERQTSTPMLSFLKTSMNDPSSSAIQMSSINSTAGGNSIDADISPMPPPQSRQHLPLTISPKRNAKKNKMAVEATPLRQLMSKSIQRAIAEHGHYRQSAFIGQRKMSFNSSHSSDSSMSLQKFQDQSSISIPLDLRLSPAIRRYGDDDEVPHPPPPLTQTIEFKQIEVIIRQSGINGENTTATTNYRSCFSETGRSESMPEIHFTPKVVGNMMKKTISFETPLNAADQTQLFAPIMEYGENKDDDDEVFYTPNSSPVKYSKFERQVVSVGEEPKPKIWSFMRKLSENISGSLSNENLWNFQFKKPDFFQKAEDYFKRSTDTEPVEEENPSKRRRTSSRDSNCCEVVQSPAHKRAKITGRKPINRMRKSS